MTIHLGDIPAGKTLYIPFFTLASNLDGMGASVTISDFAVTDVEVYKDGSVTQRSSDAGYALLDTDGIDFDSHTGIHGISIDLADDTDTGFYATGSSYWVVIGPITVDGQTVNVLAATFNIENALQVSGGAATNTTPSSYTLTTGTQSSGTIASVAALDGTNHEHTDTTGAMDLYYEFTIGSGTPTSVTVTGYLNGNNDDLEVYGYDWVGTAWVRIGTLNGKAASTNDVFAYDMFTNMVGTGASQGLVRVRFTDGAFTMTSATLAVDQIFCSFTQGSSIYDDGAIWIDTGLSNTNTVSGIDGVSTNPVSTIAAANTLATNLNLNRFRVAPGSTITFAAAQAGQVFIGDAWTLALGGQNIAGSAFYGATVTGIAAGTGTTQIFDKCIVGACSHIKGTHLLQSGIAGTQTVAEAGDYFLDLCHSGIAGNATWVFDFGGAIGDTNLNVRNYSGGIQLENMGDAGTDTASIEGQGQVIEGTCTGGAVTIRGAFTTKSITNLTITDDARFNTSNTVDVNVTKVKGTTVTGSGSTADPWGP